MADSTNLIPPADKVGVTGFAPCPTCHQYSHSIGEDALARAFMHFETMVIENPLKPYPTGYVFSEETRDAAQVLIALARHRVASLAGAWQPIAMAPKGIPILAFSADARAPGVMIAELNDWEDVDTGEKVTDWTDYWAEEALDVEPTHWMPLPAPPATLKSTEAQHAQHD
jgi:hypothetical protein